MENGKEKSKTVSSSIFFSSFTGQSYLTSGKLLEGEVYFWGSFIASMRVNTEAVLKLCSLMYKPDGGSLFRKLNFQLRNNSSAPFNIQLTSSRSAAPRDKSYMPHKSDTLYVKPLEKSCSFASTFQSAIWYLQNINIGRDFYYHLLLPPTFFHFWLEIWDSEWWNCLPIIFVHVTDAFTLTNLFNPCNFVLIFISKNPYHL